MRNLAVAVVLMFAMAPASVLADPNYWDSVLARAIATDRIPCDVAYYDAINGRAPYLQNVTDIPLEALGTAARLVCTRNLGQWGVDPKAASRDVFRRDPDN